MFLMLADFWLYPLLGAAFVAGYARTVDDEGHRAQSRLAAAADLVFLAALPLLALLLWRHGWLAGAAALLTAWAVAVVGDQLHRRVHAPRPRRPSPVRQPAMDPWGCRWSVGAPPGGVSRFTGQVAAARHHAGHAVRHARRRGTTPAGRGGKRRLSSRH